MFYPKNGLNGDREDEDINWAKMFFHCFT